MAACIPSLLLLYPFLISTTEQSSLPIVTVVIFFGLFVSLNSKNTWNSCAHLTWLANKFLVSLLNFHFLRTHLYREKSHLLLWRRGCCLCCRSQLLWNPFSMFVATAMLWSKFPHNLCLLRQDEIVSTWVGNARMNTPKLRMASTSHLLWFQHGFYFRHQNSWSISDYVLHAIFMASPGSLLNTRTTSLPRCVETRSDPAAKIFSHNLEVCT